MVFLGKKLTREGFPARISLYMDAPRWHGDDVDWQNQGLSMTLMPFKGGHAIIDFLGPHFLKDWRARHAVGASRQFNERGGRR